MSNKTVKVQKIPKKETNVDDLLSMFCYHYPQYKYSDARELPFKRIVQMLKVAEREQAKIMLVLCKGMALTNAKPKDMSSFLNELRKVANG